MRVLSAKLLGSISLVALLSAGCGGGDEDGGGGGGSSSSSSTRYFIRWGAEHVDASLSGLKLSDGSGAEVDLPWEEVALVYGNQNRSDLFMNGQRVTGETYPGSFTEEYFALEEDYLDGTSATLTWILAPPGSGGFDRIHENDSDGNWIPDILDGGEAPGSGMLIVSMNVGEHHPGAPDLVEKTTYTDPAWPGLPVIWRETNVVYVDDQGNTASSIQGTVSLDEMSLSPTDEHFGQITAAASADFVIDFPNRESLLLEGVISVNGNVRPAMTGGGGSSGGSSGGGGECAHDSTPYYGDVQADSFCWAAGLYRCGDDASADAQCEILAGLVNDGGAKCPYC